MVYPSRAPGVTPFYPCDSCCPSFIFLLFFFNSSCVPVPLDCPFLIASLVFSNVFYLVNTRSLRLKAIIFIIILCNTILFHCLFSTYIAISTCTTNINDATK